MEQSPQEQIESILRSLEAKGVPAAPVLEATALATSHPEAVGDLAIAVMRRFPKGGTFLDGALSYLPQEAWPELARFALDTLERSGGKNAAAASVIEYASLQCPSALHPHLDRIFVIRPNARCYYERYPWRESGDQHLGFLRTVIQATTSTDEERARAWTDLCETRHAEAIEYALSCADHVSPADWSPEEWVQAHLHLVGLHREKQSLRRLCPASLFHLQFPEAFFEPETRPPWLARIHPTWKLPVSVQHIPFGGSGEGQCSLCDGTLHRLLVLEPIPPGLGVTGQTRLELSTCLSCLGWERQPLFYRHDPSGSPSEHRLRRPPH